MAHRTLIAQLREPIAKRYRLINASFEAHPQLYSIYDSLEDALSDATALLGEQASSSQRAIGVEVSTRAGGWRTLRHPSLLAA